MEHQHQTWVRKLDNELEREEQFRKAAVEADRVDWDLLRKLLNDKSAITPSVPLPPPPIAQPLLTASIAPPQQRQSGVAPSLPSPRTEPKAQVNPISAPPQSQKHNQVKQSGLAPETSQVKATSDHDGETETQADFTKAVTARACVGLGFLIGLPTLGAAVWTWYTKWKKKDSLVGRGHPRTWTTGLN